MDRKRVGIVVFENVEVLDFCGPFEVFSTTRLNEQTRRTETSPFEVLLVAASRDTITTTGGMQVLPHFAFDECPRLDILVVPGGWGTRKEIDNSATLDWVRSQAAKVETLACVCTGRCYLGKPDCLMVFAPPHTGVILTGCASLVQKWS
jgi:putative intracellular protease/amidase